MAAPSRESKRNRYLAMLLWVSIVFAISPLPASLTGISGNLWFLFGCTLFLAYFLSDRSRYDLAMVPLAFLSIAVSAPSVIYWREPALALYSIYFVVSVLVVIAVDKSVLTRFSSLASATLLIMSIGAWVGFVYALLGGPPLFTIQNPDERLNNFYLTTLSNWSIGNLIRPAGLFDEPGTLSFLICFVAALRHRLGQSKRTTWLLLGLGLVTTSLAHFVYIFFHALQDRKSFLANKKYIVPITLVGLIVAGAIDIPASEELGVFFSRLAVTDGQLGGDSRSDLLGSALSRIDTNSFYFGLDSDCIVNATSCASKGYDQFGETPAGLVLLLGIFLAAPYFVVLAVTAYVAVTCRSFVFVGLLLLLLQRPYVTVFGYSLLILLVAVAGAGRRPSVFRHRANIAL